MTPARQILKGFLVGLHDLGNWIFLELNGRGISDVGGRKWKAEGACLFGG